MSWSVTFIGKPEKVAEAIEKHAETLSGQSKVEYEDAAPHLAALVRQNFNNPNPSLTPMIKLTANGHGTMDTKTDEQLSRAMTTSIETLYGTLV